MASAGGRRLRLARQPAVRLDAIAPPRPRRSAARGCPACQRAVELVERIACTTDQPLLGDGVTACSGCSGRELPG